jgi:hypothetical protein
VRNRTIDFWGSLASIIGLVLALFTIVFSEYTIATFVSLLAFETTVLLVWIFYNRSKIKMLYPYEWEETLRLERYVFVDQTHVSNETVSAIRSTKPVLTHIPVKAYWTGIGEIAITSRFHREKLDYGFDVKSGALTFDYPLGSARRFADPAVVHYIITMTDKTGENLPYFSVGITRPTELLMMEVVLGHKEQSSPAQFGYMRIEESRGIPHLNEIQQIDFDPATRTYRVEVANPIVGRRYRLSWEW